MTAGLGYAGILVGLVAAAALVFEGVRVARSRPTTISRLRPPTIGLLGGATTSVLALVAALVGDDFSVRYAVEHSHRSASLLSAVTAAWGAGEGRLLLGALLVAVSAALVVRGAGRPDADDGRLVAATATALGVAAGGLLALLATVANPFVLASPVPSDGIGPALPGPVVDALRPVLLAGGRDLSTVSTAEMEQVVAANPTVVGMRLALVERYLGAGDPAAANRHAGIALALDPPVDQRQEALKFMGWSAALLGRAREGASLLEQSLALEAGDRDAIWFLANVRLVGLGDPGGAEVLLRQLLAGPMTDHRRREVEERLLEAHLRAAPPAVDTRP